MGNAAATIRTCDVATDGSFAVSGKTYTVVKALTANTEATFTLPTFADLTVPSGGVSNAEGVGTGPVSKVFFAANGDFWANYDITLSAVPAADIVDGTAPEFKPQVRIVTDVKVIHLIAPVSCLVSIMCFQG